MIITVGISEAGFSANKDDEIVTHALGSCVGLVIYDKRNVIGGMLHFMLPKPLNRDGDKIYKYGETAIPLFFKKFTEMGGDLRKSILKAAGGALINKDNKRFNIGLKNILALNKMIWQYNLMLENADLGGEIYRTMHLKMKDGKVFVKNHKKGIWEL